MDDETAEMCFGCVMNRVKDICRTYDLGFSEHNYETFFTVNFAKSDHALHGPILHFTFLVSDVQ